MGSWNVRNPTHNSYIFAIKAKNPGGISMAKTKVNAREVVRDIRAGMQDSDLIEKYGLSPRGVESLFNKLVTAGLLEQSEVDQRQARGRGHPAEAWRCPSCGMPYDRPFDVCPSCGVITSKVEKPLVQAPGNQHVPGEKSPGTLETSEDIIQQPKPFGKDIKASPFDVLVVLGIAVITIAAGAWQAGGSGGASWLLIAIIFLGSTAAVSYVIFVAQAKKKDPGQSRTSSRSKMALTSAAAGAGIIVALALGLYVYGAASRWWGGSHSSVPTHVDWLLGMTYDWSILYMLKSPGPPETLPGTDNFKWVAYFPKNDFTMVVDKESQIIEAVALGRVPHMHKRRRQ